MHRLIWPLLALGAGPLVHPSPGQESKPSEYEVKAVYLYNFAKFTRWPETAGGAETFDICVLGSDPFGSALDHVVSGEDLHGKRAEVRRIHRIGDAGECRILFVSLSERSRLDEVLDSLRGHSVLTVSDIAGFSLRGGMIELLVEESRVRFEVNLEAATAAGLSLRSELLRVAKTVHPSLM